MSHYEKLQHGDWECKYHVIFIPKYRRNLLYGQRRQYLGEVFRRLARQKKSEIEEGHLQLHPQREGIERDLAERVRKLG